MTVPCVGNVWEPGILQLFNISACAFHSPLATGKAVIATLEKPAAKRWRGIFHCCGRLIFNFAAECSRRGCFISHHGFREPWCNLRAKLTLSAIPEPGTANYESPLLTDNRANDSCTLRNSNGRLSVRHFIACPQYLLIMCLCINPRWYVFIGMRGISIRDLWRRFTKRAVGKIALQLEAFANIFYASKQIE